jgi:hypothetical protein
MAPQDVTGGGFEDHKAGRIKEKRRHSIFKVLSDNGLQNTPWFYYTKRAAALDTGR